MFYKKGILQNSAKFTVKYLCQSFFFNIVEGLRPAALLKETLAKVFCCEFCDISKNTLFNRTPPMAASAFSIKIIIQSEAHLLFAHFLENALLFFLNSH